MNDGFVRAAGEIAREAGQFLKHFSDHHRLAVEHKGNDFDFVTNADRESQRLIAERLKAAFPDHRFVGEEDGLDDAAVADILSGDEYCWVCDPLDGTVNYIHHLGLYAVSVGLVRRGRAVAGAIYLPEWDELFTAQRGCGALLNGRPVKPSSCDDLRHAFVTADMAAANVEMRGVNMDRIKRVIMAAGGLRIEGSACVCIAQTACGRQDAYWNLGLHAWDVAAGAVILEEAGCAVSTVFGDPFTFDMKDGFLCAAPGLKGAFAGLMRP
ncbi:MAG: inositol monophosphatase [Clostridia bacterium]|nr:inositol monophosphatase [Clostridia bacterium]